MVARFVRVREPTATFPHYYLETSYDPRASSKKADRRSITSLHSDYQGKPGFMGCYLQKSWKTEAAARAAIDHFRAWVDGGRRKQTAAASEARGKRVEVDDIPLPERYSKRRNLGTHVGATLEKFLPLARVRKFAHKTRAYRRAYREEQPNSLADVEKLVKAYKSHRSADVFDKKFCHAE